MATQNSTFPQKLFSLMENEPASIVCWNKNGLSFRVVDTDKFSEEIIPKYFRHTKMTSFQRQLNLYGFRRVTKGDDIGSYYHPKFQKGRRDLMVEIKRLPGKSSGNHSHGRGTKPIMPSQYHPSESNIVEVFDGSNRPVSMSKLTMNLSGMKPVPAAPRTTAPSNGVYYPQRNGIPAIEPVGAVADPIYPRHPMPPHGISATYVNTSAVQFYPVASTSSGAPLPTVQLSKDVEMQQPPSLLRNLSVNSAFDEEYRLASMDAPLASRSNSGSTNRSASRGEPGVISPPSQTQVPSVADVNPVNLSHGMDAITRPLPPAREESESWVKLGSLDNLPEMDAFDIDTVFE